MKQVDLKSTLNFKDFFKNSLFKGASTVLVDQSDICDWSAYVAYAIQPIRALIDLK